MEEKITSDPNLSNFTWTEEDKARLELAMFGKSDRPLAWLVANGKLCNTKEEAGKIVGYTVYPLYGHPPTPKGYKLLKDTTFEERSFKEDTNHENGNYHCICCECGRGFQGHKRRVICKVCSTTETGTPSEQKETPRN